MPDGARNGISTGETSDLLGGEWEDPEDHDNKAKLPSKSSNNNMELIFDLFATNATTTTNGSSPNLTEKNEKNGSTSPRLRLCSGPREADCVMLVLNQKQKDNEEIVNLIDTLRHRGVTCLFIRNSGTSKSSSCEPPQNHLNRSSSSSSLCSPNNVQTQKLCNGSVHSPQDSNAPPTPLPELTIDTTTASATLPGSQNPQSSNLLELKSADPPDDPRTSPSLEETPTTSSSPTVKSESLPPSSPKKKRRRRKKDPYSSFKKKKKVPTTPITPRKNTIKAKKEVEVPKNEEIFPELKKSSEEECNSSLVGENIPKVEENIPIVEESIPAVNGEIEGPIKKEDPYVFIEEDVKELPLTKAFSPKTSKKNGHVDLSELVTITTPVLEVKVPLKVLKKGKPKKKGKVSKKTPAKRKHSISPDITFGSEYVEHKRSRLEVNYTEVDSLDGYDYRDDAEELLELDLPPSSLDDGGENSENGSQPLENIREPPEVVTEDVKTEEIEGTVEEEVVAKVIKRKFGGGRRKKRKGGPGRKKVQKQEILLDECVQPISILNNDNTTTNTGENIENTIKEESCGDGEKNDLKNDAVEGVDEASRDDDEDEVMCGDIQDIIAVIDESLKEPENSAVVVVPVVDDFTLPQPPQQTPSVASTSVESVAAIISKVDTVKEEAEMPPPPSPSIEITESTSSSPALSFPESMQLRRPSFYSLIAGNVRTNLENHLDGRFIEPKPPGRRRKRARNGFLLHHGDNCPEDPEAPYKLHLATQIILKLNKRRSKFKPKEDKGKSLLSYLKLIPKRASRGGNKKSIEVATATEESGGTNGIGNVNANGDISEGDKKEPQSVFSGEWIQERNFICNVCGHVETYFWDMVNHKGEIHPGVIVTHVELPDPPPIGFRVPPAVPKTDVLPSPPPCTKCNATFTNYGDLHRHIFECAGNTAWLEELKVQETPRKRKQKRKRGFNSFKRRLSNTPRKKPESTPQKKKNEVFKCEFCTREFKTEGWLKNHITTHSLPISIPLSKLKSLPTPTRASMTSTSALAPLPFNTLSTSKKSFVAPPPILLGRRTCVVQALANKT